MNLMTDQKEIFWIGQCIDFVLITRPTLSPHKEAMDRIVSHAWNVVEDSRRSSVPTENVLYLLTQLKKQSDRYADGTGCSSAPVRVRCANKRGKARKRIKGFRIGVPLSARIPRVNLFCSEKVA
uniref:Uncharacterized protein n=1 Tax=Vespula pensylvanica TaxID=30213 RepID=A0A834NQD8_VESPE|nr:hypothetical protein H0235_012218 [Vespula pensylvanica]